MTHTPGKIFPLLCVCFIGCGSPRPAPVETGRPSSKQPEVSTVPEAVEESKTTGVTEAQPPAEVRVFVMSKCPFAAKALTKLFPVLDQLGDRAQLSLDYIVSEKEGKFQALHGEDEVKGNKQQLCAVTLAPKPSIWRAFIACQNRNWRDIPAGWEACADEAGLDRNGLGNCVQGERGSELLRTSMKRSQDQGAKGSPTILIGGETFRGPRSPKGFLRAICARVAGTPQGACASLPPEVEVQLVLLSDRRCTRCKSDPLVSSLRQRFFPRLTVTRLDYSDPEGKRLFQQLKLKHLPAVLLKAGVERAEAYPRIQRWLQLKGTFRQLKVPANFDPTAEICDNGEDDTGNGKIDCNDPACRDMLSCRQEKRRRLDVFVMSQCPFAVRGLDAMKEVLKHFKGKVDFHVHYIAKEKEGGGFSALHGQPEVEENIRQICAQKLYGRGDRYLNYIWCRNKDIRSDQWRGCAKAGISAARIERCVKRQGKKLLAKDIRIAEGLSISGSPTWLANNRHKFNGITPEAIKTNLCKHNPGLAGCDAKLSDQVGQGSASCGGGEIQPEERSLPDKAPEQTGPEAYGAGVPACDDYIQKFLTCIRTKMPDATRPLLENALRVTAAKWRAAASKEGARKDLADGCAKALQAARTAMKEYGCKW